MILKNSGQWSWRQIYSNNLQPRHKHRLIRPGRGFPVKLLAIHFYSQLTARGPDVIFCQTTFKVKHVGFESTELVLSLPVNNRKISRPRSSDELEGLSSHSSGSLADTSVSSSPKLPVQTAPSLHNKEASTPPGDHLTMAAQSGDALRH